MSRFLRMCNQSFQKVLVALPEYVSVTLSLLNLQEESLGRSKPATNLMQAHSHCVEILLYPSLTELPSIE